MNLFRELLLPSDLPTPGESTERLAIDFKTKVSPGETAEARQGRRGICECQMIAQSVAGMAIGRARERRRRECDRLKKGRAAGGGSQDPKQAPQLGPR